MRVLLFGTYDLAAHPRVGIIAEGLRARGFDVDECDAPLGFDTAARVKMLAQPWRVPALGVRLVRRWGELARRVRGMAEPDVVVVGYLGHFDVHLARFLFRGRRGRRRIPIVLDHLISAADTARDRRLAGGFRQVLLRAVDAAALRAASLVVVDTDEHREALPARYRRRAVVVPVGAAETWFETSAAGHDLDGADGADTEPVLHVVFYGLFTPLQGTATIGEALRLLDDQPVRTTMIGHGQDLAETRAKAGTSANVRWIDWAAADELPALVAEHDVCLGIFGTGPKALRVVPNKVYQGAAAGCAVITSDTAPQRRAFGDAAVFVPPGDAQALADAIRGLARHPEELAALRERARTAARERFTPARVVDALVERIEPVE
jgi:glycosyltransferase involved in cell wall biosynthesis